MEYSFGYCATDARLAFAGGTIEPHEQFEYAKSWIAKYAHRNGFIYPPEVQHADEGGTVHPNTRRPAHLFQLPASHVLTLPGVTTDDSEREIASFIIHLLGYYLGGWYQFSDWRFDGRVPLKSTHNIAAHSRVAEHFLSHGWEAWNSFPRVVKRRFTNLLFMLNRSPTYEWDWEHFAIEYMIFDGCFRTARDLKLLQAARIPHSQRIEAMCDRFAIPKDAEHIKAIVRLRNDLFHEALWSSGRPGAAHDSASFYAPLHLRRLNQRLIPALLNYQTSYVSTSWWTLGRWTFDTPKTRSFRNERLNMTASPFLHNATSACD